MKNIAAKGLKIEKIKTLVHILNYIFVFNVVIMELLWLFWFLLYTYEQAIKYYKSKILANPITIKNKSSENI